MCLQLMMYPSFISLLHHTVILESLSSFQCISMVHVGIYAHLFVFSCGCYISCITMDLFITAHFDSDNSELKECSPRVQTEVGLGFYTIIVLMKDNTNIQMFRSDCISPGEPNKS